MKDVTKHSICNYFEQFLCHLSSYTHSACNEVKIINMIFKLNTRETYASKMPLTPKFDASESEIMKISETLVCNLHLYVLEHTKSLKRMPTSLTVPQVTQSLIKHTTVSVLPHLVITCQEQAFPEHHCGQGSKPETRPLPERLHPTAR